MVQKSRRYIKSIVMCYTDTDSLHYEVTMNHEGRLYTYNQVVSELIFSLNMDRSNFNVLGKNVAATFDDTRMDLFKSETGDDIVLECVYVSPKCYSIKIRKRGADTASEPVYKKAMKACPKSLLDQIFDHDYYRQVLVGELVRRTREVESKHIRFNKALGRMTTQKMRRRPITCIDVKRFYVDTYTSYAYHHPSTFQQGFQIEDITTTKGCYIKGTERVIDLNSVGRFNYYTPPTDIVVEGEGDMMNVGECDGAVSGEGCDVDGENLNMLVSLLDNSAVLSDDSVNGNEEGDDDDDDDLEILIKGPKRRKKM